MLKRFMNHIDPEYWSYGVRTFSIRSDQCSFPVQNMNLSEQISLNAWGKYDKQAGNF
jgi:predicted HD phosphohydrolase